MPSRRAVSALILGALLLLPGCHAGTRGGLASREETPLPNVSLTTAQAIERHNINAKRIKSLDATSRIVVQAPGVNGASTDGRMSLERPRNFILRVSSFGKPMANIGSNNDEFWFWTREKRDNSVYVCSYEDLERDRSPLSAAFQPEWIMEAMGLREIPLDEAKRMASERGENAGTIKLVSTLRGKAGETLTKETTLDTSGLIKDHRLYQGRGAEKTLLAYATVEEFRPVPVSGDGTEVVNLPRRFQLGWMPEKLVLKIQLETVEANPQISSADREARFAEPTIQGSKRVNLAELVPAQRPATSSRSTAGDPALSSSSSAPAPRTRTSRPAPSSRGADVRLGAPEPFGVDDSARADGEPLALTTDLDSSSSSDASINRVVRPALPRAVDR